jgi:hypothetical protein
MMAGHAGGGDFRDEPAGRRWAPSKAPIVLIPGFGAPAYGPEDMAQPGDPRGADEPAGYFSRWMYGYWGTAVEFGEEESPVLCVWPAGFGSLVSCP